MARSPELGRLFAPNRPTREAGDPKLNSGRGGRFNVVLFTAQDKATKEFTHAVEVIRTDNYGAAIEENLRLIRTTKGQTTVSFGYVEPGRRQRQQNITPQTT